jgi:glycosyltransferase involved in cell wall biosynthesis
MPNTQRPAPSARDYVAYAGRSEPEKGFNVLVEAITKANVPLKVAGNSSAFYPDEKDIPKHVEFTGHLTHREIGEFYTQARMLVVPSLWHETFGLVVAEALSCGTPVIVTDMGALPEVAGPGGLVVPAGSSMALQEAISRLWNDVGQCRRMADAGREHVKQYSDEAYVKNLLHAYEKVLGVRHSAFGVGE